MTKQEAYKKVDKALTSAGYFVADVAKIMIALEALDLIKFEEPKKPKFVNLDHCGGVTYNQCTVKVSDMIEALLRLNIICIEKAD